MKLAEALNERAHISQKLQELKQRITQNAKHQEGDKPAEDPMVLLKEFNECSSRFDALVVRINKTNNGIVLSNGVSLIEALAMRESLKMKHSLYRSVASEAVPSQGRYSKSEIKFVSSVPVVDIQSQADQFAKEHRELDSKIQQSNWNHDLV